MSLIVQNDSGSQADANGYITVDFFRSYHDDRCNEFTNFDVKQIEGAIVRATDHVDQRFRFVGEKQNGQSQTTAWPRLDAEDIDDDVRSNVPREVKEATAEYALIALTTGLSLNPSPTRDASGRAVQSLRDKVDVIEKERVFAEGASFELPKHPIADHRLFASGLAISGKEARRA